MQYFDWAIFEPEDNCPEWAVLYYCAYTNGDNYTASESYWVVPGTWDLS